MRLAQGGEHLALQLEDAPRVTQQQLALATPDAYNPFSGGCVSTPSYGDCSPSSQAAIDGIVFDLVRESRTTLTMADFKMSRGDLFALPAGNVGIAFGAEARRETQRDDRDANLDGTNTFTDMVTGETNLSNVAAVSPNPDTRGSRNVGSAYVEFAVPLVSEEMGIPLVHRLDIAAHDFCAGGHGTIDPGTDLRLGAARNVTGESGRNFDGQ